jgi:hypothetical protein
MNLVTILYHSLVVLLFSFSIKFFALSAFLISKVQTKRISLISLFNFSIKELNSINQYKSVIMCNNEVHTDLLI